VSLQVSGEKMDRAGVTEELPWPDSSNHIRMAGQRGFAQVEG
jgi:hypothetical protein